MNLRPPGYEPDELPTALLRDIDDFAQGTTLTGAILDFLDSIAHLSGVVNRVLGLILGFWGINS